VGCCCPGRSLGLSRPRGGPQDPHDGADEAPLRRVSRQPPAALPRLIRTTAADETAGKGGRTAGIRHRSTSSARCSPSSRSCMPGASQRARGAKYPRQRPRPSLRALAALGLPDGSAPVFAGARLGCRIGAVARSTAQRFRAPTGSLRSTFGRRPRSRRCLPSRGRRARGSPRPVATEENDGRR